MIRKSAEQLEQANRQYFAARQEVIAVQYAMARHLYAAHRLHAELASLASLQREVAESSNHIRWLLEIEPTCVCCI
jgi:uncharacterized CHY-type Zn-finger protein